MSVIRGINCEWVATADVKVGDTLVFLLADAEATATVTGWRDKVIDLSRYDLGVSTHRIFTTTGVPWWVDEAERTNTLTGETLIEVKA